MPGTLSRFSQGQQDFLRLLGLLLGYPLTFLLPRRLDRWLMSRLTGAVLKLWPNKPRHLAERMSATLAPGIGSRDLLEEARGQYGMTLESAWGRVRCLRRDGWRPEITVEGLDRLEEARAQGSGTILWRMSFCSSLVVKVGLWRAGIEMVHLSMEQHGAWSDAWAGLKGVAPLYARSENWYLAERVIIPLEGSTTGVMRAMLERLKNHNAVLSIVGDNTGSQNVTVPFLGAWGSFAIGAPALAWKAGSILLPVHAVREGPNRYRVMIGKVMEEDRALPRKEFVRRSIGEFARRMEEAVAEHPGSWGRWGEFWNRRGRFAGAPPAS